MKEILFKISGHVQGVGFRVLVQRIARSMQMRGWVKNQPDKTVLVLAQGSNDNLRLFQQRLSTIHNAIGPNVNQIELQHQKELGNTSPQPDFLIAT